VTATLDAPPAARRRSSVIVEQPGIYDISNDDYHADPVPGGSLSSSTAKILLPPSCPAKFRYAQDHPQPPKRTFDFGHAAHGEVLGSGPKLVIVDADDWRKKAAQAERDEAYADGAVPLLRHEYQQVQAMAAAIRSHPIASALLNPENGDPEQSLFWADRRTGVQCRARFDWLPRPTAGRMIIPDYKTTVSADLDSIDKNINTFGYHRQAAWYREGAITCGIADKDATFVFIFQEKTAPYVVTVAEPDPTAFGIGRILNRQAIDTYRQCMKTGIWPGYHDDVYLSSLPRWVESQFNDEEIFR